MLLGFQKIWLKPELKQEYADLLHWFETGWIPPVKLLFLLTALSRVFKIGRDAGLVFVVPHKLDFATMFVSALRHPDEKARPFGNFLVRTSILKQIG
jgi:hypothetical protein